MRPSALVTGASGFIGSHLVRRLVEEGWRVHLVTRGDPVRETKGCGDAPDLYLHTCESSGRDLYRTLRDVNPDVVFHLASFFRAQHQPDDIPPLVESNLEFGAHLLDAMASAGVRRLVNTGTSWQHADGDEYHPVCLYAATKQAFEAIAQFYVEAAALQVVTLKLTDTYGPHDRREKLFTLLRRAAEDGLSLSMSPGEQLLDLVYIDDVVEGYLVAARRLLAQGRPQEQFLLSSGVLYRLRDVVRLYERVVGRSLDVHFGARPYRDREVMTPWQSGPRLPGWRSAVSLEDGIRRMESMR